MNKPQRCKCFSGGYCYREVCPERPQNKKAKKTVTKKAKELTPEILVWRAKEEEDAGK